MKALYILFSVIILLSFSLHEAQGAVEFRIPENAAQELPPGVPRTVETNGTVIDIDQQFTTRAYREYTCDMLLNEASGVAQELHLPEPQPITRSNLVSGFISPFGFTYVFRKVGNISTTNYSYGVEEDYRFSHITVTKIEERCHHYADKYQWPISRFDTNAAYQLATQWLSAVHMDVKGLNRDFDMNVMVDNYWNNVKHGELPKQKFTPIYFVSWSRKGLKPGSIDSGAYVHLFLPTKQLLQLAVNDSKYILRPPIVFTNLAALFPGKAEIKTNLPGKVIVIDGSK